MEKFSVSIQMSRLVDALSTHQETSAGFRETEAKLFITSPARRPAVAVVTTQMPVAQCLITDLSSGAYTAASCTFARSASPCMLSTNMKYTSSHCLLTFNNSADDGVPELSALR